jgi:hypothetical protein
VRPAQFGIASPSPDFTADIVHPRKTFIYKGINQEGEHLLNTPGRKRI